MHIAASWCLDNCVAGVNLDWLLIQMVSNVPLENLSDISSPQAIAARGAYYRQAWNLYRNYTWLGTYSVLFYSVS